MSNIVVVDVEGIEQKKQSIMEEVAKMLCNEGLVSSKTVALLYDRQHKNVMQAIRNFEDGQCSKEFWHKSFQPVYRTVCGVTVNNRATEFLMTRDGFMLIVFGFRCKKAAEFKMSVIRAFNKMEEELRKSCKEQVEMVREKLKKAVLDPDALLRFVEEAKMEMEKDRGLKALQASKEIEADVVDAEFTVIEAGTV